MDAIYALCHMLRSSFRPGYHELYHNPEYYNLNNQLRDNLKNLYSLLRYTVVRLTSHFQVFPSCIPPVILANNCSLTILKQAFYFSKKRIFTTAHYLVGY
jgi:hypothetical protein